MFHRQNRTFADMDMKEEAESFLMDLKTYFAIAAYINDRHEREGNLISLLVNVISSSLSLFIR